MISRITAIKSIARLFGLIHIFASPVCLADQLEINDGDSIYAFIENKSGEFRDAFVLDLSSQLYHQNSASTIDTFRFKLLSATKQKICVQFSHINPNKKIPPNCFVRKKDGTFEATGLFFGKMPDEVKLIQATLVTEANFNSTLKGTKWGWLSVNDCSTDFIEFREDGQVYSLFDTPDGVYSYRANISFPDNGILEENGKDSDGEPVRTRSRVLIGKYTGRLYISMVAQFLDDRGKWMLIEDGYIYSQCDE